MSASIPVGTVAAFHAGCRVSYANIMNMYMKDLRVYATTLNGDDIKQLYQTPFAIDSNQNIYAREFKEGSGK